MPAIQTTTVSTDGKNTKAARNHALRALVLDMVAPVAIFYGVRGLGGSIWLALIAGGAIPAAGVLFGLVTRRGVDAMGFLVLAALAVSAAFSLVTGSPRALLARDGLLTGAWAAYMYLSLLARRPATFVISRPLLEGRRVFDQPARRWVRPADRTWDDLWADVPQFRHIWTVCTLIWGTAILADAVIRITMAYTLPVNLVPALGGALWPVTFVVLQVITNVYFFRSGFWQILRDGTSVGSGGSAAPARG
jgi:hypothetical protein